jgi:hypothetical protein
VSWTVIIDEKGHFTLPPALESSLMEGEASDFWWVHNGHANYWMSLDHDRRIASGISTPDDARERRQALMRSATRVPVEDGQGHCPEKLLAGFKSKTLKASPSRSEGVFSISAATTEA